MVVIEPEPEPSDSQGNRNPDEALSTDAAAAAASSYGDDSDGFETASDGEHEANSDGEHEANSDGDEGKPQIQQHPAKQKEEFAIPKDDSYSDALNDEELKQKAAAQANDAKMEGNTLFVAAKYEEALLEYERALQVAPEGPSYAEMRSIFHSNRAICFFKLGKYDDTIKECTKALELNPTNMKALVRRGEAREKLEHFDEAIADWKKVLELDPSNDQAKRSIRRMEPLAEEKREKLKEEMLGKLKELGNSVLGRFGMSVDNFKTVKDPNTGSYSVSFQR